MSKGRSIGLAVASFSGVRVTGQLTYIPAYRKSDGQPVNAKCTIPVAKNSHRGTHINRGTGQAEKGRTDYFNMVAWGKLADIMARSCNPGKALDLVTEPRSYMGRLYNADGSPRMDNAGVAIEIPKISFNIIMYPVFGEESQNQITKEINEGLRPANWNVEGHPDYALWTSILKQRAAYVWDGQSPNFLWARVVVPQGVQLDFSQNANATSAAPPAGSTVPYVQNNPNMQTMVGHAVQTHPGTTVAPVQTVQAHGGGFAQVQTQQQAGRGGGFQPVAPTAPMDGTSTVI